MTILRNTRLLALAIFIILASALNGPEVWAQNNYGAIALSPTTLAMGWSYDYPTRGQAERSALARCRKYASDCRIATWFRNACGAVAIGNGNGWGANWGNSIKQAKRKAMRKCQSYTSNCYVSRWVCTTR